MAEKNTPEAQLKDLEAKINSLEQEIEYLKKANDRLQQENEDHIKQIRRLQHESEGLAAINESLCSELEAASKPAIANDSPISNETFELDGEEYGFALPGVNLDDNVITASDVLASEDLQRKLVKIKSGFIYLKD